MKVKKSEISALLNATFPEYTGKKFFVVASAKETLYDLNFSGGTRNAYRACTIDGKAIGNGQSFNEKAPWNNNAEGAVVEIPQGAVIARECHFCGKEGGITFYINPADMPRYIGFQQAAVQLLKLKG